MTWLLISLLTFLAFGLVQGIYALAQAIVGWKVGAIVETISVGFGPTLFVKKISGVEWKISAIPMGSYTKFFNRETDGEFSDSDRSREFDELESSSPSGHLPNGCPYELLPISARFAILLIGPITTLLIGLSCMAIPVYTGGDQVVVDSALPETWSKNGVPHLTVATDRSTWNGQWSLFRSTVVDFFLKIVTLQSLQGWGGYVGWLSTLGSAGAYSANVWLSCFGVTMFGMGASNLLPIPVMNGGHMVFLLIERLLGRSPDSLMISATYAGFALMMFVLIRMVVVDVTWLVTP